MGGGGGGGGHNNEAVRYSLLSNPKADKFYAAAGISASPDSLSE